MEPKVLRDQLGKVMVLDVGGSGGGGVLAVWIVSFCCTTAGKEWKQ